MDVTLKDEMNIFENRRTGVPPVSIFVLLRVIRVDPLLRKNKKLPNEPISKFLDLPANKGDSMLFHQNPNEKRTHFHLKKPIAKPMNRIRKGTGRCWVPSPIKFS
jgi:hypothetical protein